MKPPPPDQSALGKSTTGVLSTICCCFLPE